MSDEFQHWREALAGQKVPVTADFPNSGYYKMRKGRDGPWLPVAIWTKDGAQIARVADEVRDPVEIWTWCAKHPVTKEAAKVAFSTGRWPDDPTNIGHNSGDLTLAEQIKDVRASALEWLQRHGITDQTSCDMAANFRSRLQDLARKADAERDAKKRPHLEAGRAIDAEYKPLVDEAKGAADSLRDALSRFMAAEKLKAEKAAAEAARAENERRRAEYEYKKALAAKSAAPAEPAPAPVYVAPAPVVVQAGGQVGRKVGLRSVARFSISDYAAALDHVRDHPDVKAAVEKVCFAQARAGADVPGISKTMEEVAV